VCSISVTIQGLNSHICVFVESMLRERSLSHEAPRLGFSSQWDVFPGFLRLESMHRELERVHEFILQPFLNICMCTIEYRTT
jgi:hypothetical protein